MEIIQFPDRKAWKKILARSYPGSGSPEADVAHILERVRQNGDAAVREFSLQFDKVLLEDMAVSENETEEAAVSVPEELKTAIRQAKKNIELFHRNQIRLENPVETMPGVLCWRKTVAIEKVGLYIPGGTASLFSTSLMLSIPAVLAGCSEIILCSPPDARGKLNPALLYAAGLVGVKKIFKIGGAQAIAAMAYGTASIPRVYKIFGPGNQYVTGAKQLLQQQGVAIDMPAGPSEVMVYADESANPAFVAADLLSQAEHGPDSQALLVTCSVDLPAKVNTALATQLDALPRKKIAEKSLGNSRLIVVKNEDEAIALVNEYAPEHLILACANPRALADRVINAGSVFLGHFSPETVGDYASGTNHTLPTNGYARSYSGISVDSFVKKITFQQVTREGLENIGKTVISMAEAEGLQAHANAVRVRFDHE